MLTIFFDHEGVVHDDYALERQTGNQEYYVDVLRRLRDAVRRKRPASWQRGDWQLRHDNGPPPPNSSHVVQNFVAKHQIPQVQQPMY
jgi:hypothetical protein